MHVLLILFIVKYLGDNNCTISSLVRLDKLKKILKYDTIYLVNLNDTTIQIGR